MKKSRSWRFQLVTLMVLALAGTMLYGCSKTEPKATDTQKKATDKKEYKIAWYVSAPHPFFEDVKKGVEGFEKDYGITVEKQVGPDWSQPSETQNVEALAAKGLKYFVFYPSDPSGANGMIDELTGQGSSFISFGAQPSQPTKTKFYAGTDIKEAAVQATEYVIKQMGEKGNLINVLEVLEDTNTKLRKEAVEETVKKYPNVKIIQEISGMKSPEEAVQKIDDSISANLGKVDGIVATGDITSAGVAQVLSAYKQKGNTKVIHAIGIDTDPIVMKAIKDGVLDATISQNPYGQGYLSCLLFKYIADGWTPKQGSYNMNTGSILVTKDNIDTYQKDIAKLTEDIKATIETKYLEKK